MEKAFSTAWVASTQPRKQRKYRYNAPLHIKRKFLNANLAEELRKKYHVRSLQVRKGDTVKIMRGTHKGKKGKVERVSVKQTKVYVENIHMTRKDGSKSYYPLQPSKLQITELNTDDRRRFPKSNEQSQKQQSKVKV
ncbi:50S ribosomal protein L24 [Candidatus Woesearchaeota archaeon]|nr:50S ribosomal protein L24 [Candidatus Woesearchaeota archaeon]